MMFLKKSPNQVRSALSAILGVYILFDQTSSWATPPPKECIGTPPMGFTPTFPSFPLGESAWILFGLALFIPIYSHIQCKTRLHSQEVKSSNAEVSVTSNQKQKRWCYGLTLIGILTALGSTLFFLLLLFTGVFRNDCHFCQLGRPQPRMTIVDELELIGIMFVGVICSFFLIRRFVRSPLFQHGLMIFHIPLGLLIWIMLLSWGNQRHLAAYCLP